MVRVLFPPNSVFLKMNRLTLKLIEKNKGPRTPEDKGQGRGGPGILPNKTPLLMIKLQGFCQFGVNHG